MFLRPVFKKIADIDQSKKEYIEFRDALISVDWQTVNITGSSDYEFALNYTKGVVFNNTPWSKEDPKIKNFWASFDQEALGIEVLTTAEAFFEYIESLLPAYKIFKAEIMATNPESVNRSAELSRMHFDNKIFHNYSHRCQLAFLTNPGALLFVEGESLNVSDTAIYEFNNKLCHWGVNWGNTLKLVLVLDLVEIAVWNKLLDTTKDIFLKREQSLYNAVRFKKFYNNFIKEHNLVSPPGIEPGSTL